MIIKNFKGIPIKVTMRNTAQVPDDEIVKFENIPDANLAIYCESDIKPTYLLVYLDENGVPIIKIIQGGENELINTNISEILQRCFKNFKHEKLGSHRSLTLAEAFGYPKAFVKNRQIIMKRYELEIEGSGKVNIFTIMHPNT